MFNKLTTYTTSINEGERTSVKVIGSAQKITFL